MSAETLRAAASLMRERATGLPAAPWSLAPGPGVKDAAGVKVVSAAFDTTPRTRVPIAEHVASWHPTVALAVADLLDNLAEAEERNYRESGFSPIDMSDALAVARTYLGDPS